MSKIKLVVEIDEETYNDIQSRDWKNGELVFSEEWKAIHNGIPLPKGHGRIADMDEAIKCIEDVKGDDAIWAISLIEWACAKRTIIEADKAERSE